MATHVIEVDLPSEAIPVSWPSGAPGGTITAIANTASATITPINSLAVTVTPAGPTNFGHVDLELIDGNGELGRARVIFLIPVVFS